MKATYDLVHEPSIPCVMLDGTSREFGLLEVLKQAHDIREVYDPSPLVTAALHRLLLAVLYRVFQPKSLKDWKAVRSAGGFHHDALADYFNEWGNRFDLFHETHPFYQSAGFETKRTIPVKRLPFDFACGNNATLFDHSSDDIRPEIPAAVAARWVITCHTFAPTAGKSETIHTKDSPWSRGAVLLLFGGNLFDTLTMNLLNLFSGDFPTVGDDKPCWEGDGTIKPEDGVTPNGLLDYLTWQSRCLRLLPNDATHNPPVVCECFLAQGKSLQEGLKMDPMLAYRRDEKRGLLVWIFNEDRSVWRDSHALLNLRNDAPFQLPRALNRVAVLVREGALSRKSRYQLAVLGQRLEKGQPTVHFWRHERMSLPVAYLDDPELVDALRTALDAAESVGYLFHRKWIRLPEREKQARGPLWELGEMLLSSKDDSGADADPVVKSLAPARLYWSRLEVPFRQFLEDLPGDVDTAEEVQSEHRERTLEAWRKTLRRTARNAFDETTRSLDNSARVLKAVATAEKSFNWMLHQILPIEEVTANE